MISSLNHAKHADYAIALQEVKKPGKGLELSITVDPRKVMVKYDFFDAITKAKGVEFHLYNQALLDRLQRKDARVLQVAQAPKKTIIIDCGHGGHDTGTIGCFSLAEKNITLAVGKQLEQELKKQGFTVCMTRSTDSFVALDERTRIANTKDNAILISLHANNSPHSTTRGLETFCLDEHLFKKTQMQLATAIDVIINDVATQQHAASKKLAGIVHESLLSNLKIHGYEIPDRKVKHAATQVLMGIKWPGILIEIDFLSNEKAAALLNSGPYQQVVAQGICKGISKYLLQNPAF